MDNIKVVIENKKIHLLCLLRDYINSLDGKKIAIIKKMYNYNIIKKEKQKEEKHAIADLNLHGNNYTINGKNVYVVVNTIDVDNLDSMYSVIKTPYGILNTGNTCFFNGTLQAIINDKMYITELCNNILFKYTNIDKILKTNNTKIELNKFNNFYDITIYLLLNLFKELYDYNKNDKEQTFKLNDNIRFLQDIVSFIQTWLKFTSKSSGTTQQDADETYKALEQFIGYTDDNINSTYRKVTDPSWNTFIQVYKDYQNLKFEIPVITRYKEVDEFTFF